MRAALADVVEGFASVRRTPWLLSTLLFASVLVLLVIGPLEVLTPFAIRDRAGGGPQDHALVLAAFGVAGALASLVVASRRMPRRYLTVMIMLWGAGCVPPALFGVATRVWVVVVAGAVVGATVQAATVIWGTLLQRRVPPELLGRVSRPDLFVSLASMPLSMALAGPASAAVGITPVFLVVGLAPTLLAVVALAAAGLRADELAHPLDAAPDGAVVPGSGAAVDPVPPATAAPLPAPGRGPGGDGEDG